jgi:putative acetyltransferase
MSSTAAATPISVRPQRVGDEQAVATVVEAAFARPVVVELVARLQSGPAAAGGISLVAEVGGALVGHVQLSRAWVDAAEQLVDVLTLSPLSVRPDHQRQGIGGRLVRAALAQAESAGWPLVFLEGSPQYYSRLGFEPASGLGFGRPSARIPEPGFQVAVLPAWRAWMVGRFVYSDAFWELDCVGLRPSAD